MWIAVPNEALYHHGIKGQRWGVRRFQNPDGSLTAAGRRRQDRAIKKDQKAFDIKNRKEAYAKIDKDYEKAYSIVEKHGLDYDDVLSSVTDTEIKNYRKEAKKQGISDSTVEAVIKYNKELFKAEQKEQQRYDEAAKKTVDMLIQKYGKETIDDWRRRKDRR